MTHEDHIINVKGEPGAPLKELRQDLKKLLQKRQAGTITLTCPCGIDTIIDIENLPWDSIQCHQCKTWILKYELTDLTLTDKDIRLSGLK